jgi:hypothetical protein
MTTCGYLPTSESEDGSGENHHHSFRYTRNYRSPATVVDFINSTEKLGLGTSFPFPVFKASYLKKFSVWRLCSVDDRIINECKAVCGMRIGRGNRSTRRKPAAVPQISHDI